MTEDFEKTTREEKEALTEEKKREQLTIVACLELKINEIESARDQLKSLKKQGKDPELLKKMSIELRRLLAQGHALKRRIEGAAPSPTITAIYPRPQEDGTTTPETIRLDFEKAVENTARFYRSHDIEIPDDFEGKMRDIWERNYESITTEIEKFGFNDILLIPEQLPDLATLDRTMTKDYEKEKGNKTHWWVGRDSLTSTREGARIVLLHNTPDLTAHPALKETLDKKYGGARTNGRDNKAQDFIGSGESLTIEEYLILQRKVYEESGAVKTHLDSKLTPDGKYIYCTWLPGSKSGARVVIAHWNPADGQLSVHALVPGYSDGDLGCRLSRCFR